MDDFARLAQAAFVGVGIGIGLVIGVGVVAFLRQLERRYRDDDQK